MACMDHRPAFVQRAAHAIPFMKHLHLHLLQFRARVKVRVEVSSKNCATGVSFPRGREIFCKTDGQKGQSRNIIVVQCRGDKAAKRQRIRRPSVVESFCGESRKTQELFDAHNDIQQKTREKLLC